MDVSIVIPIYNSHALVEGAVNRLVRVLEAAGRDYEILLRDDGSRGDMRSVFKKIASEYVRVRCFHNPANQGLGATLRALFHDARGERVVYCDCDLPFGEDVILKLLDRLESCDIAVASRYAGIRGRVAFLRWVFSRAYFWLCKILFHIPVFDVGSGCVAIRRSALQKLNLSAKGFDIHAEIYVQARHWGLALKEVPAEAAQCTRGSFSVFRHGFGVIAGTVGLYLRRVKDTIGYEHSQRGEKKRILK